MASTPTRRDDHGVNPSAAHRGRSRLSDRARLRPSKITRSGCLMARPARTSAVPPARSNPRCSPKARSGGVRKQGANADIGIEGFFAPTPADTAGGAWITSVSPDVSNPILGIFIYQGTINATAVPPVYCSTTNNQIGPAPGQANLQIGQTVRAANGVTVTFDGWVPWAEHAGLAMIPARTRPPVAGVAMGAGADRLARRSGVADSGCGSPRCVSSDPSSRYRRCPWRARPQRFGHFSS